MSCCGAFSCPVMPHGGPGLLAAFAFATAAGDGSGWNSMKRTNGESAATIAAGRRVGVPSSAARLRARRAYAIVEQYQVLGVLLKCAPFVR